MVPFSMFSDERAPTRIAFLTLPPAWTELSLLPSNVAGNVNSKFDMTHWRVVLGYASVGCFSSTLMDQSQL